jgi:hypothetical protein
MDDGNRILIRIFLVLIAVVAVLYYQDMPSILRLMSDLYLLAVVIYRDISCIHY